MNELANWLETLTPDQRAIADRIIRVYGDMLMVLEGRQAVLESRMRELEERHYHYVALVNDHERRISAIEQLLEQEMIDIEVELSDYEPVSAA